MLLKKTKQFLSISIIFAMLVGAATLPYSAIAFAQQSQNARFLADPPLNQTGTSFNITSLLKPGNSVHNIMILNTRMSQITASNKPADIATLAYIWGFSPVTMLREFNYVTSPNVPPGLGHGPANTKSLNSCVHILLNASFTDVVTPNADTLYCSFQLDLKKEPVVLVVPPIAADRYYTFEFLDAYTNDFAYVGTRATGFNGGTYLVAGPDWHGQVPQGMTKIWSPTNLAWILNRILAKGPSDLANVNAIQGKIIVKPLSAFQGKPVPSQPSANATSTKQVPIGPQPSLIAPTGIKIYDEIGQAMIGNPLNPPDPGLVTKLASIGIGPGKTPSTEANATIKEALQTGITEGQNMINARAVNLGNKVNGWQFQITGLYGTDYLFRAAITKIGLGANIAQEALYPITYTDSQGIPLVGTNNYTVHFNPRQTPPVNAFWSVTMYNNKSLFVNNPINRYSVGKYTEGLKNNTDGSLDIYISTKNPGPAKQSNWLPAPTPSQSNTFFLMLRMYLPQPQILNGTWSPPPVQRANATG